MLVFRTRLDHAIEGLKGTTDVVGQVVGERVPARVQEKPSWHGLNGLTEFDRSFGRRHFLTKWLVPWYLQPSKLRNCAQGFPGEADRGQGSRKIRASHKETFCFVVGQIGSLFSDYIITTAGQKRKRGGELSSRIFGCLTVCAGAKRDLHEHGAGWPSQFTICRGKQSVSGDWGSSKKSISYEIWEAFLVGDWKIGTSVRSSLTDKTDSSLVVVLQ